MSAHSKARGPALDAPPVKLAGEATVLHKPGAVRLDGYSLLVYAPAQRGPGIRTEDVGASVEDIAARAAETPDYERIAAEFGTTPAHVAEAIRYATEAGRLVAD